MRVLAIPMLPLLLFVACSRPDDQKTGSVNEKEMAKARQQIDPAAAVRLDSANAAFRRNEFAAASRLYREAARIDDENAAPWFGVYMAETALRNPGAADSALERVRSLQPGASLVHPQRGISPHPASPVPQLPPQHPQITSPQPGLPPQHPPIPTGRQ